MAENTKVNVEMENGESFIIELMRPKRRRILKLWQRTDFMTVLYFIE